MKTRKTMSERALVANKANGGKTKGPKNTDHTKYNAVTYNLLAKNLRFQSDSEKLSFDDLMKELVLEHRPCGSTESFRFSSCPIACCKWARSSVWNPQT